MTRCNGGKLFAAFVGALLLMGTFSGCASKNAGTTGDYAPMAAHQTLANRVDRLEAQKPAAPSGSTATAPVASRRSDAPEGYKAVAMALPTGSEASSAVLVEKMIPESISVGEPFEYYIKVTNLTSDLNLKDVVVKDVMSEGFQVSSSKPEAAMSGQMATWNLGTLSPDQAQTITVTGSASTTGPIEACATVDYTPYLCIDTMVMQPDLAITYRGPANASTCDCFPYSLTVTNPGSGVAENVRVSVELPAGLAVDGSRSIRLTIGDMAPGASETREMTVCASAAGTFTSQASAVANNVAQVDSTAVTTEVCMPAIEMATAGTSRIFLGNPGEFSATITNTAGCDTQNFTVTANVPSCLSVTSASGGGTVNGNTITWTFPNLGVGQSTSVAVYVNGESMCSGERVTFVADGKCVKADGAEPVDVMGIPAILLEVVDIVDPVRVGDTTTYVITATNQGSAIDTNVIIEATVEDMTITSGSGATAGTISGKTIRFAPLPRLEVGAKAEWRVEVRADAVGDQRFAVSMNTDQLTRPVDETEATNTYE
jgi:hypothetical protein